MISLELAIAALGSFAAVVAAYYAVRQRAMEKSRLYYVNQVRVQTRDGFTAIRFKLMPGDLSVDLERISIPGHRIAPAPNDLGMKWSVPSSVDWRDWMEVSGRFSASTHPAGMWISASVTPPLEQAFSIKVKTKSIFLSTTLKVST